MDASLAYALTTYLALLRDPAAGEALLACYAADAPMYVAKDVFPAHALPAAAFGQMMAQNARQRREATGESMRPDLEAPRVLAERDEGDRAVVWFAAREAVAGHEVTGAVGFVREDGTWRVGWATLAAPADWTWRHGLAQAVADVAVADAAGIGVARGWLDVAYYRDWLKPRPQLHALPEARFRCGASLGCCDIGYRIEVPHTAQAVVDAMPWDEVRPALAGTVLPPAGDGKLLVKEAGERCRFLDDDKHCILHKTLGRAVFPVCTLFPVHFTNTPDGVAVSLDMTCPSARKALGPPLLERTEDLYMRLAVQPPRSVATTFHVAPGQEVGWPAFAAAEADLVAALARPDMPLHDRLMLGQRALAAAAAAAAAAPGAGDPAAAPLPENDLLALLDDAIRAAVPKWSAPPGRPRLAAGDPQAEEIAAAVRGLIFAKNLSFALDLRTAWHVGVFQALAIARMQAGYPDGKVPAEPLWRLNGLFFHTPFFPRVRPDMGEAAALMAAFSQPGMGPALLALAS